MKRFLHVSIVWGGAAKSIEQLRPIFDLADDWLSYGSSNWIIYTGEDQFIWQGRIMAIVDTSVDRFFICEISDVHDTSGFLSEWTWKWLRKPRIDDSEYGKLLPYIDPST
jgi:hypothetical protein